MSILSVMPAEWWEPADLEDEDDPLPTTTSEALTVTSWYGWWSADQANDDDE